VESKGPFIFKQIGAFPLRFSEEDWKKAEQY